MSEVVCCPLDGGGPWENRVSFRRVQIVRARKQYFCEECRKPIVIGEQHESYTAKWEDCGVDTVRTCLLCAEIRDHFACEGWIFGEVWSQLADNFFPEMKAGGPCMEGLSPAAKAMLFERRLAWQEANA